MSPTLSPGITHVVSTEVGPEHTPRHLAPIVVLSTPEMIRLMEEACTEAVQPLLDETQTTVGTHVDVSHESAARGGEIVDVEAALTTVDGPRLAFRVQARVGDRVIGRGTHRRHVIDTTRFAG